MSLVKVTATDGTPVEFIKKDPKQGGVKDVYFDPTRKYVVAFFRKKLDPAGKERIERLVGQYRKGIFEQNGADYWRELFCWPERFVEYDGLTGIVMPIYQSKFFFGENTSLGGVEKDGKWFASAKNFNRFVPDEEKGDLLGYLRICLNLSRAVRRLHAAGLTHSDLSYKNCLIDPSTGSACIIDIDGLVVPGVFPPDVLGTPDFIAPEVIATLHLPMDHPNRKKPRRETDQHALSVLIYQYLFHRHPLRGRKIHSADTEEQDHLEMGEKALFIENPNDHSNQYVVQKNDSDFMPWVDCGKLPYTIMGPYLKECFESAFMEGLHEPRKRPTADNWEDALVKTCDLVQPCLNPNCIKKWYVFDNSTKPVCPYCGTSFRGQLPVLDFYSSRNGVDFRFDGHRLMVYNNQYLYRWHVDRTVFPNERLSDMDKKPVGYFVFHKERWLFINQSLPGLMDVGLAMGITGTSVAKEAADIILLDDSFASIVKAVMWGRSLYANIQKFILFQLTINVAALGIALLGPFLGVKLPLTVTQMLWVNLIMDTFAALALASEPPNWDLMNRPPRRHDAFIVTPAMGKFIFTVGGLLLTVFLLLALCFSESFPMDDSTLAGRHNLSIFFSTFVFLQFWNLFNARMLGQIRSAFSRLSESRMFILIALVIGVGQILMTQYGGDIFRTVPLSFNEWIAIILGTSIVVWIGEIIRGIKRSITLSYK